jgi:ribonuclease HI
MLGAMYAVRFAILNGFSEIEIRYDYQGIEKWVTGEWRSRTELTGKYAQAMRQWGKQIAMYFTKVAAHTNVTYNELADKMAKRGLTEGNGVPKVRRIEDMEEYHG